MKKILFMSLAAFLPIFASAATLNNVFNIGTTFPVVGGTTSVSSSCGVSGANSTVNFALVQNGNSVALSANLPTGANGGFSGNITFPGTYSSGQATLVATCVRSGDTINSPTLNFAAPVSTAFGLPAIVPTLGGVLNLSGACGYSSGSGSVQVSLVKNGTSYYLNNFNLSQTGTFSGSVIIPNSITTGSATLTATCSNGATFSSVLDINPSAVNSFAFSSSPVPGATTYVSGNCTDISSNANGTVSFSVLRNGNTTNLATSNNLTNNNAMFNASVFFPTSLGSAPATFIVTCPNGATYSNVIMLGLASPVVITPTTTPVGGVDAGFGPQFSLQNSIAAGALLLGGLLGFYVIASKKTYVQK